MKISAQSYNTLHGAIAEAKTQVTFSLESYLEQGLTPKRYRWDLLWYSTAKLLPQNWVCDVLYNEEDMNDNHIDTTLKAITGTK